MLSYRKIITLMLVFILTVAPVYNLLTGGYWLSTWKFSFLGTKYMYSTQSRGIKNEQPSQLPLSSLFTSLPARSSS